VSHVLQHLSLLSKAGDSCHGWGGAEQGLVLGVSGLGKPGSASTSRPTAECHCSELNLARPKKGTWRSVLPSSSAASSCENYICADVCYSLVHGQCSHRWGCGWMDGLHACSPKLACHVSDTWYHLGSSSWFWLRQLLIMKAVVWLMDGLVLAKGSSVPARDHC
jgi:hypothetical protein